MPINIVIWDDSEQEEYRTAMNGIKYFCALTEIKEFLRRPALGKQESLDGKELTEDQLNIFSRIYDEFFRILRDQEIADEF